MERRAGSSRLKYNKETRTIDTVRTEMHDPQELMRKAVRELQSQYGWDERTAASVMLTVTTAVGLAPKQK